MTAGPHDCMDMVAEFLFVLCKESGRSHSYVYTCPSSTGHGGVGKALIVIWLNKCIVIMLYKWLGQL